MYQKSCRLTLADKFYGPLGGRGGGAPEPPPPRNLREELKDVYDVFKGPGIRSYRRYVRQEPILRAAQPVAIGQLTNLPTYTKPLESLFKNYPADIRNTLLQTFRGQVAPALTTGGALTPGQQNAAEQQALSLAARSGMATGPQGIAGAVLGSETARQARFNQALGQSGQITGQLATDLSQRLGLAQGVQDLTSGALRSAYGGQAAQTGTYSSLINPLLSYGSDLANTNYNAQAAANIAAANQSGAKGGGTMQLVGSVVGAAATAY
jgi:hypothetical protein